MIKINDYFEISEGSEYELVSETYCGLKSPGILIARDGGRAEAYNGGTAEAYNGGTAEAHDGGRAVVYDGGTAVARDGGTAEAYNGGTAEAHDGGRAVAYSGGRAVAYDGGRAVAHDGGRAVARDGGRAEAHDGGTAEAHDGGEICELFDLADDGKYKLTMTDDGYFYAGCAVNLTREQSLARWDRDDDRACLFTLAILSLDWGKPLFSKQ